MLAILKECSYKNVNVKYSKDHQISKNSNKMAENTKFTAQ